MNDENDYVTVWVNEPEKAQDFLITYLGLFDQRRCIKEEGGQMGIKVGNSFGNKYLLVAGAAPAIESSNPDKAIIFNTDNCLRDYHKLMQAGIKIERVPRYTGRGLELILSDNYGNHYLLLEKRNYSE